MLVGETIAMQYGHILNQLSLVKQSELAVFITLTTQIKGSYCGLCTTTTALQVCFPLECATTSQWNEYQIPLV